MAHSELRNTRRAFTLIELLVVIGIILILLSILLPALSAAKEVSRRVQCANNLHQIGASIMAFASDNGGRVPYGQPTWTGGNGLYGGSWWPTYMYSENYFELTSKYGATDSEFICPTTADADVVSLAFPQVLFGYPSGNTTESACQSWAKSDPNIGGIPLPNDMEALAAEANTCYDDQAIADIGYTYYGMPPYSNPPVSRKPWEVWKITDHLSQVCGASYQQDLADVNADNQCPPLMSDIIIWQPQAAGSLSVTFKYNHGKDWHLAVIPPTAAPTDSSTYPTCQFAGSVYANVLYVDGHVDSVVDQRPWIAYPSPSATASALFWFK